MRVSCVAVISGSPVRLPLYRNYRWGDSSSFFLPKHGLRSDLRVPNLKNFSWGSMPPDPPTLFTLTHTQWLYQSKIAGTGPAESPSVTVYPPVPGSMGSRKFREA